MATKPQEIVLIGCGGHARSVADVLLFNNPDVQIVFFDSQARPNERIFGFPVVREVSSDISFFHVAVGCNRERERERERERGATYVGVISRTAYLGSEAEIHPGVFIAHRAHIGPLSVIEEGAIINTNAVVEHEVHIGRFCHIAPNSTVCGRCSIGDFSVIGAGAVVKDKISICADVLIGAGAVVVNDITEPGVYAGSPARKIKELRNDHCRYDGPYL